MCEVDARDPGEAEPAGDQEGVVRIGIDRPQPLGGAGDVALRVRRGGLESAVVDGEVAKLFSRSAEEGQLELLMQLWRQLPALRDRAEMRVADGGDANHRAVAVKASSNTSSQMTSSSSAGSAAACVAAGRSCGASSP